MHSLYQAALDADDAFEQAIIDQFGRKATRWTVQHKDYNEATKRAYQAKLHADQAWIDYQREKPVALIDSTIADAFGLAGMPGVVIKSK